jgi:hypothetical protein
VAARRRDGVWTGDVERLADVDPPWPFGVPLLADEIEAFAARIFAR